VPDTACVLKIISNLNMLIIIRHSERNKVTFVEICRQTDFVEFFLCVPLLGTLATDQRGKIKLLHLQQLWKFSVNNYVNCSTLWMLSHWHKISSQFNLSVHKPCQCTVSEIEKNAFKVFLVHGQVTIIFIVSVCLSLCLSVCLFVQSFSQPSSIRFGSN